MQFENDSQSTLKNCIDLANKAINIGEATADELNKQEEKLDKMDNNIDIIDTNVKNAHRTLDNISSFIKSLFGSIKYPTINKTSSSNDISSNNIQSNDISSNDMTSNINNSSKITNKITDDDELDELYNLTIKMKELNISINKSIDRQTEKIQKITNRVDNSNINMNSANNKIDVLLK